MRPWWQFGAFGWALACSGAPADPAGVGTDTNPPPDTAPAGDSASVEPPVVLDCGDNPPEILAFDAHTEEEQGKSDVSCGDSLVLSVTFTDPDGDLGRYAAYFWTDYVKDGVVDDSTHPDFSRGRDDAAVECDIFEVTAGDDTLDDEPPLEVAVRVYDAAGHASELVITEVVEGP